MPRLLKEEKKWSRSIRKGTKGDEVKEDEQRYQKNGCFQAGKPSYGGGRVRTRQGWVKERIYGWQSCQQQKLWVEWCSSDERGLAWNKQTLGFDLFDPQHCKERSWWCTSVILGRWRPSWGIQTLTRTSTNTVSILPNLWTIYSFSPSLVSHSVKWET